MYFDFVKDYVIDWHLEDDTINWSHLNHSFLRTSMPSLAEITEQEKRLKHIGYEFPAELKNFWTEIGCGYLCSIDRLDNGLEEPKTILDIYFQEGDWTDIGCNCDIIAENELPFFRTNNLSYLTIGLEKGINFGKVYKSGEEIASTLTDFIKSLMKNPAYYLD